MTRPNALASCATGFKDLEEVDYHYAKSLAMIFDCPNTASFEAVAPSEEFAGVTFTGRPITLMTVTGSHQANAQLTFANRHSYVARAIDQRLKVTFNFQTHSSVLLTQTDCSL